jgi:hypothetical protein
LDREYQVAIDVLVQAVVIAGAVLQKERCRPRLPGGVAPLAIGAVVGGEGFRARRARFRVGGWPPARGRRRALRAAPARAGAADR